MIPHVTTLLASGPVTPGEGPAQTSPNGGQGAEFRALLERDGCAEAGPVPDVSRPLPGPAVPAAPAKPATDPAITGKILPSDLPELPAVQDVVAPAAPDPNLLPGTVLDAARHGLVSPQRLPGLSDPVPVSEVLGPEPKLPATELPEPIAHPILVTPLPLIVTDQQQPAPEPFAPGGPADPAPPRPAQGSSHRTLPELPGAASPTAHARMAAHETGLGAIHPQPGQTILPPSAEAMRRRAEPAEEVRIGLALPRPGLNGRLLPGEPQIAAPALDHALPQFLPSHSAQPHSAQMAVPTLPVLPASATPQDFAAVIERIAAARDAATPQAVSMLVAHQEFGPVRLRFRPDEAGLNVALSSPDPDFARAAAAAPMPVAPVQPTENTGPGQGRAHGDPGQSGTAAHNPGRDGASGQRREGQPQPQSSSQTRQTRDATGPRQGIFA